MKQRKPILEAAVTACLALLLGFFFAAGAALDDGGYLGYGAEHYALNVSINWLGPELYLATLMYALPVFAVLMLLWRALDWIAATRAQKLVQKLLQKDLFNYGGSNENDVEVAQPASSSEGNSGVAKNYTSPPDEKAKSGTGMGIGTDTGTGKHRGSNGKGANVGLLTIRKRWFWITALLLLCCWLPYWLGLWPGIFNYDAHYQYQMLTTVQLQTHHPLLHTFLLDGLVLFGEHVLGSVNTGVALYIGLALVASALTFSWMLYTMAEEGAGRVLLVCSFLFLAVNPAFVIWLVSTNKDVLFTVFLLLTALLLYRVCRLKRAELPGKSECSFASSSFCAGCVEFEAGTEQEVGRADGYEGKLADEQAATTTAAGLEKSRLRVARKPDDSVPMLTMAQKLKIGFSAALALFLLVFGVLAFRTSAVYSFIVFLPFAVLLIRKHLRIRLMSVMAAATVVFLVLYILLTQVFFQVPSGPWQALDALSLPRQQLSRVWVQANSAQDIAAFSQVFSKEDLEYLDLYEADDADPSRSAFRSAFEDNPFCLLALYVSMGAAHPGTYADAALLTCYEAWYPGAVTDGYVMEPYFAKPGVARSSYIDVSAFTPASEAWILEDFGRWLREFGLGNVGLDLAPLRLLCSPATYMWLLLITLARTTCVRNRRGALVCVLLLTFGLTALLSPLVVMRYYFMIMAATPLLLHIASSPSWQTKSR